MHTSQGSAHISISDNNFLTEHNGHAVVGITGKETGWSIKAYGDLTDPHPKYLFIIESPEPGLEDRALTLDKDSDTSEVNILVQKLENPPSERQLWTLEDGIMQMRYPPIVHARIQSIARPDLSAAIGGLAALPRIYLNVAGVPNDPGSESQKWRLDYFLPIDKD